MPCFKAHLISAFLSIVICSFTGTHESRHLVPGPTAKLAPGLFFATATPLFEEERNACLDALVAYIDYPLRMHGARPGAGLAAHDNPVNMIQVEVGYWPQQRFERQEFHGGRRGSHIVYAKYMIAIFHTDAHPDVWGPIERRSQLAQSLRALGQYLKAVPMCLAHDAKDAPDEIKGNLFVKEVAHGIDKYHLRLAPGDG